MKLIKILFSPTGGTKKIADIISKKIHSNSIDFLLTGACFKPDMTIDSEDICIIAVPAFAGRVPLPAANRLAMLNGNGAKAILIASYGNRDRGGLPLYPQASSSCYECGICADVCPVGAIDKTAPRKTDIEKCITCMSCVSACPQKARTLNPDMLFAVSQKLKEACAGRKPNQIMIGE